MEKWKDVIGYQGIYQVSDLGNVKSLERKCWMHRNSCFKILKEIILKPIITKKGYRQVNLAKNSKQKTFRISILVAIAFLNHKPDRTQKIVVDHIDNNQSNDRLDNLQLITNRENCSKDQFRHNRSSQFVGVSWNRKKKKWGVSIHIKGRLLYLGAFGSESDTAHIYQRALKEIS